MTRLHYISPSLLPSKSANAVHVMLQCDGLVTAGAQVTLYAKRAVAAEHRLTDQLRHAYGVDARRLDLVTTYSRSNRGDTLRIAAMALRRIVAAPRAERVLSRNLYAAYALAVLARRPLLFETHQLELGVRKHLQRALLRCPWVTTVAISQRLVECLADHLAIEPRRTVVLHDAAPDDIEPVDPAARRKLLSAAVAQDLSTWQAVAGYFGHLYAGRGIEIIEAMATARPRCLFLVYGGNDSDVERRRAVNLLANLRFMGHVPHPVARRAMTAVDVLLMPYQQSVSIGAGAHDTARWMSPMKMFEYLAAGVPVISSDLPVLREVLRDGGYCLLVPPDRPSDWITALDHLIGNPALAAGLGACAHAEYRASHTWTRRAEALLAAARAL
jgi:glycosyltransferase involved in cell wall biosynthesis